MARRKRRPLMSILTVGLVGYVTWGAFLFLMQRRMMFPGADLNPPTVAEDRLPERVESVDLPFSGGFVEGWFIRAPSSSASRAGISPAVIFAHGNAELIGDGLHAARSLAALGTSVLLVEYPGYGRSDGAPSRESIGEAFLAAYDWLSSRPEVSEDRIVGFGRSLGSGAITDLAQRRPLKALVLQSSFVSVAHFARRYLLPSLLVRDNFDNLAAIGGFEGPVLLFHGTRDRIIPHAHSERLAHAASDAELVSLDCGHNDCPPNWDQYIRAIRGFLVRAEVLSGEI